MKKSNNKLVLIIVGIIVAVVVIFVVVAGLFIRYITKGSYGKNSVRNIGWVKKMNDAFPDDEFTYVSYQKVPAGGLWVFNNKNVIIVDSKKYPNMKVTVGWNDDHTKVVTDYNYFRYKDDLAEYYKNKMSQYFTPDEMEVTYLIYFVNKTELKDYTFDEFRESRSGLYNLSVYMKYNNAFPSEEEMTKKIELIISDLDDKIELKIYMSHNSVETGDTTEGNERYVLSMDSPTRIKYLNHYTTHWTETKTGKKIRRDNKTLIYENKDVD